MNTSQTNQQVVLEKPKINFFARTLLWFGYGLILTFLITFGLPAIFVAAGMDTDTFAYALYVMCGIGGLGVLIFSIIIMFKSFSARGFGVITFTIYSILMGLALTPLYLIGTTPDGMIGILYSLLVTGGIFVIMGLIGVLSKGKIKGMWLLVMGLTIGSLILSLVNLFIFNEIVYWIVSFAILLVFILYVGIDFAIISRHPVDADNRFAIVCAFQLYTDFIIIFIRLLPIILRLIARND